MKLDPVFLGVEEVLELHQRMIREFGGSAIVRDYGLLDAAVAMPAAHFEGRFLHSDIPAMAAAYLFHLCAAHPFIDGNKRTAVAAAETFLLLNGMTLKASAPTLKALVMRVARGEASKAEAVEFFRRRVRNNQVHQSHGA